MEGLKKREWDKLTNVNSSHFNGKFQILKSSLFYGEARLQPSWEHALIYLAPLCHDWYKVIRMLDVIHLLCKITPRRSITENAVQAGQLGASLYQSA